MWPNNTEKTQGYIIIYLHLNFYSLQNVYILLWKLSGTYFSMVLVCRDREIMLGRQNRVLHRSYLDNLLPPRPVKFSNSNTLIPDQYVCVWECNIGVWQLYQNGYPFSKPQGWSEVTLIDSWTRMWQAADRGSVGFLIEFSRDSTH